MIVFQYSSLYHKFLILNLTFVCLTHGLLGQIHSDALGYYQDALRYGQSERFGSARFQGIGGASVALGGDVTTVHINPAGLGFYQKNEIHITSSLIMNYANSAFLNEKMSDVQISPHLAQFGLVLANKRNRELTGVFAVTLTRMRTFQSRMTYSGVNHANSLIDYFLERNDQITPWKDLNDGGADGITTLDGLAYWTFLINPTTKNDTKGNSYASFVHVAPTKQEETITETGKMNAWNFAYGVNFKDKLFLGGRLGLHTSSYVQEKKYAETVTVDTSALKNFNLNEKLVQYADGFNASLGLIYKPVHFINLGLSLHTPTITRISDVYDANLDVNYNNYLHYDEFQEKSQVLQNKSTTLRTIKSKYSLYAPVRIQTGMTVFFGKYGFWTTDLEFVNYGKLLLLNPDPFFSLNADNQTINDLYKSAVNFKTGAELRLNHFRFRVGIAYFDTPISNQINDIDRRRLFLTAGFGFRDAKKYLDLAFVRTNSRAIYKPYSLSDNTAPVVNIQYLQTRLLIGLGIYF